MQEMTMLDLPNAWKAKVERIFDKRDGFRRQLAKEVFMSKGNAAELVEVLKLAICDAIEDRDERVRYLAQLIKALRASHKRGDIELLIFGEIVEEAHKLISQDKLQKEQTSMPTAARR